MKKGKYMRTLSDCLSGIYCYPEVSAFDFYRRIFPEGSLANWAETSSDKKRGEYTGIMVRISDSEIPVLNKQTGEQLVNRNTGKPMFEQKVERVCITDDLDEISTVWHSNDFFITSPISYAGKSRKSSNARFMYALAIELDHLLVKNGEQIGLDNLIDLWSAKRPYIPRPSLTVCSGTGLHLYYVFDTPIPMFQNIVQDLSKMKRELTTKLWNRKTTFSYHDNEIQQESIFQGYRMVGGITKKGGRVVAFDTGPNVTIEYLNQFVQPENQVSLIYHSTLTKNDAKEKYPDWYERRIIKKEPRKHWICNRSLYDWWKKRIIDEAAVGHRYYCLLMLSIYALKCGITREELENDCYDMMEKFEELTNREDNHFTEKDVLDALKAYDDKSLITYPINSITNRTGIQIQKNKRNGRKQPEHLKIARAMKNVKKELGEIKDGRPTKQEIVKNWKKTHPNGKKSDCQKDTGLSKPTVLKWWDS